MKAVVIGAGGIGRQVARHLGEAGYDVVVGSRSGAGAGEGVRVAAVDAADASALARLASGAAVLVNAVNPPYPRWATDWPPLAASFLAAAERSGAGLITIGNLYGYGRVDAPMREDTPIAPTGVKGRVRAGMWADARAAHEAGRVRAVELRASDYFGPGAGRGVSYLNEYVIAPALAGRVARQVMGDPDAPHSWTYLPDIGALAASVAAADQAGADWGRVWHVPTTEPRSMREVAADAAGLAGASTRGVVLLPTLVRAALRVSPVIRELDETRHQFERPFILDSAAAQRRFGLAPTPWPEALGRTVAALRG